MVAPNPEIIANLSDNLREGLEAMIKFLEARAEPHSSLKQIGQIIQVKFLWSQALGFSAFSAV